jgi:hypothetical protein
MLSSNAAACMKMGIRLLTVWPRVCSLSINLATSSSNPFGVLCSQYRCISPLISPFRSLMDGPKGVVDIGTGLVAFGRLRK